MLTWCGAATFCNFDGLAALLMLFPCRNLRPQTLIVVGVLILATNDAQWTWDATECRCCWRCRRGGRRLPGEKTRKLAMAG